jgi:hypothetical protein
LSSELTIQNAAAQCLQMREWIDGGVLAIDLSGVETCDLGCSDSRGSATQRSSRGQSLELLRASPAVLEVFGRYALNGLLAAGTPD